MSLNETSKLIGKWILESEENFQEFLVALGLIFFSSLAHINKK